MSQSQTFVIKFSSFISLPTEVRDSKTTGRGHVPQHLHQVSTNAFVLQIFHDTKSIFCY